MLPHAGWKPIWAMFEIQPSAGHVSMDPFHRLACSRTIGPPLGAKIHWTPARPPWPDPGADVEMTRKNLSTLITISLIF